MSVSGGPNIVENGLVLYLDAANIKSYASGSTVWNDLSGNGNTGTLTNGPTFNSGSLGSLVFDGTNDSIDFSKTGSQLGISDNTITCEITLKRNQNPSQELQGHIGFGSGPGSLSIKNTSSKYILDAYSISDARTIVNFHSDEFYTINQFKLIHLTFTILDGVIKTYTNGQYYSTASLSGGIKSIQNQIFSIGSGYGYFRMFGEVYQVKLYNKVLTDSEVLQNYNATKRRYGL